MGARRGAGGSSRDECLGAQASQAAGMLPTMMRTLTDAPTLNRHSRRKDSIAGVAIRTPLVRPKFRAIREKFWLKAREICSPWLVKLRGDANAMELGVRCRGEGVYTASEGNTAQGVAYCAAEFGVPDRHRPRRAPQTKIEANRATRRTVIKVSVDQWWQTMVTALRWRG